MLFFFLMYQTFLHKQVSSWRPTIMSPLLPLCYSRLLCRRGDTHSTTASASACIPVQSRLCLNSCKLTQVSERSPSNIHRVCSWQTQSNNVHTEEKKEREKTGRERGLASLEGRLTKKTKKKNPRVNTDVCPSHPPFDWADSLSPYSYNSRRETRRPGCCINTCFSPSSSPTVSNNMLQWD